MHVSQFPGDLTAVLYATKKKHEGEVYFLLMLQDLNTNFNRFREITLIYCQNTTIHIQQRTVTVLQPYSYRSAYSVAGASPDTAD